MSERITNKIIENITLLEFDNKIKLNILETKIIEQIQFETNSIEENLGIIGIRKMKFRKEFLKDMLKSIRKLKNRLN